MKVGRPLKFATPEELEAIIDNYLEQTPFLEYSITGLALVVGSKQLIDDYQKRDGFKELIDRAKLIIENSYEMSLRKNGKVTDIFALKNFGWTDRQEIKHEGLSPSFMANDPLSDESNNSASKD